MDQAQVLADVETRDGRDSNRADAPLRPAADAAVIDTSELSIDDAMEAAIDRIAAALEEKT